MRVVDNEILEGSPRGGGVDAQRELLVGKKLGRLHGR